MKIKSIAEAENYLYQFFPRSFSEKFQGDWGLARVKYFLGLLGSPQNNLKVIHIAGTSGKGSTSLLLSHLLQAHGFKVGLHLSPPLLDIRERFEINNKFISEETFCNYFNLLIPFIDRMDEVPYGKPTFFEILISLAYYIFEKEQVDYSVVETAMGGMLDATNAATARDKFAVITKIGFDHTQILGNTLSEIAYQKAMIMMPGNIALSTWQKKDAEAVIRDVAEKQGARIKFLDKKTFKDIRLFPDKTLFNFQFGVQQFNNLELSLAGSFQAENASVALVALIILSKRDKFDILAKNIRSALQNVQFPGRMEVLSIHDKTVIIDGAHNPQKMDAFMKSLTTIFPNKKFHVLLAFKKEKDYSEMLTKIIPYASNITITTFSKKGDLLISSENAQKIATILEGFNFKNYEIVSDSTHALKRVVLSDEKFIVITGSLYLLSEIYPALQSFSDN